MTTVQDRADAHTDEVAELTAAVVARVFAKYRAALDQVLADLTRALARADNDPAALTRALNATAEEIRAQADVAARELRAALPGLVDGAYSAGVSHGLDRLRVLDMPAADVPSAPSFPQGAELAEAFVERAYRAADLLTSALTEASGSDNLTAAVGAARTAASRAESALMYEAASADATGTTAVADAAGLARVWVAERNGCVHCLAYAGEIAGTGAGFAEGLTFGDRPLTQAAPLTNPPLHPRCRCTVELVRPGATDVADALKREARRSILRGYSLDSESQPTRLRAADRLLRAGSGMPASVERVARQALKRGGFADRSVPGAPPTTPAPRAPSPEVQETKRQAAALERARSVVLVDLTDAELDEAMQLAIEAEDFDLLDELSREADARDEERRDPTIPPMDAKAVEENRRLDEMLALIDQGVDEAEAYAAVFGASADRFTRDQAIRQLREQGYEGAGFDALARQSYRDYVNRAYVAADDDTNGYLLNKAGQAAGIDPYTLFTGPLVRAAKYASDELRDWWEANGRLTFDEWAAQLLGDQTAVRDARYRGGRGNRL